MPDDAWLDGLTLMKAVFVYCTYVLLNKDFYKNEKKSPTSYLCILTVFLTAAGAVFTVFLAHMNPRFKAFFSF